MRSTRRLLQRAGLDQSEAVFDPMDALALAVQRDGSSHRCPCDEPRDFHRSLLAALVDGFSLRAGTHVHQNDRQGLERLCKHGARPPIALRRLHKLADGSYSYALKVPLPDGAATFCATPASR
ncbi:MAG: transposase [Deltaproteobacteria bacterium]|nr:transposase [Deltaproteobacteria bacterium]